jgi:hypothetical protein
MLKVSGGPRLVIALALVALLSSGAGATGQTDGGVVAAQVTVTQSVIIRVPARRSRRYAPSPDAPPRALPVYRERKGPHCIDAAAIAGAAVISPDSVDFILKGGHRVRAKLADECPALDYYSGFYVKPPPDGQICADRDSIHTRSGGDCQVDRFRALTPIPPAH